MKPTIFPLVLLITVTSLAKCANVLSIFPLPSKSHDILGSALSKHLATIGHNVTYISSYSHKRIQENFHPIQLKGMDVIKEIMQRIRQVNATFSDMYQQLFKVAHLTSIILEDENVDELIKSNSKFDVVIHFMGMDASIALSHRFDAPLIVFIPVGTVFTYDKLMGNPSPPSYIPTVITPYDENMTFIQRVSNTVIPFIVFNALEILFNYYGNQAINLYLPGYPSMKQIREERLDLVLVNSDISSETPRPYVPNIIQIGAFHLQKPEPLGKDLKEILDSAKDGFVYFSFGTNVIAKEIPEGIFDVFKKTLGRLPFKVIMKYEDDIMLNKPDNFYLKKWFPQASVLAHPNVKLFITHGGYGGMTESLYNGVPMVCIPFYADQFQNCADAQHKGHAVTIKVKQIDESTFTEALHKVLYDEKFKNAIKFKSELYRDQPMSPMDKAVYWIEHVIKHKGAKHLKVKGAYLPWYQYHLLDVLLFITLVLLLILSIVYYSCKYIYKVARQKMCSKKSKIKTT